MKEFEKINIFWGIGFRYVNLSDADGVGFIMDACVEILEMLRFYPVDLRSSLKGMRFQPNSFAAGPPLQDLDPHDTNRFESSRSQRHPSLVYMRFVNGTLSSLFSSRLHSRASPPCGPRCPTGVTIFGVWNPTREMCTVRHFRLVLCAGV